MICQININNGIPIYEQISRQVKSAARQEVVVTRTFFFSKVSLWHL